MEKIKLKKFIPVLLGVCIVVSLGFNVWLNNQRASINKDSTGIKKKQISIQEECNQLTIKVEYSKKNLLAQPTVPGK